MVIEESVHYRIHSGGPRGGRWNEAWRQFKEANPNARPEEIYRHAGELIYRFELQRLELDDIVFLDIPLR